MESETQRDGGFATTGFSVIRTRGCAIYSASKADAGNGCMRVCVCEHLQLHDNNLCVYSDLLKQSGFVHLGDH